MKEDKLDPRVEEMRSMKEQREVSKGEGKSEGFGLVLRHIPK